jgi:hypothetical protein
VWVFQAGVAAGVAGIREGAAAAPAAKKARAKEKA